MSKTNALILSKHILEVPYAEEIEDPVLRNTLLEAWEWKRLEIFVMAISKSLLKSKQVFITKPS